MATCAFAGAFSKLFAHYETNPRRALELIEGEFPDAFLVYVADRARLTFDGKNLWTKLCGDLGINDANVQAAFKSVFVDRLESRGMMTFDKDEQANYYFYTALLHGGLSASSWETLWRDSLLPMAKDRVAIDGSSLLRIIRAKDGYTPKKTVLNILEKAPAATVAPLLKAGLSVASQVQKANESESGFTMLTSCGLPDVAMQALRAARERKPGAGSNGTPGASARLVPAARAQRAHHEAAASRLHREGRLRREVAVGDAGNFQKRWRRGVGKYPGVPLRRGTRGGRCAREPGERRGSGRLEGELLVEHRQVGRHWEDRRRARFVRIRPKRDWDQRGLAHDAHQGNRRRRRLGRPRHRVHLRRADHRAATGASPITTTRGARPDSRAGRRSASSGL